MSAPAAAASSSSAAVPPWSQIEREAKAFAEANPSFEVDTDERRAETVRLAGLLPVRARSAFRTYVAGKYPAFDLSGEFFLAFKCSDLIAQVRSEVQRGRDYEWDEDYDGEEPEFNASSTHSFRNLFNLVHENPAAFAYVVGADRLSVTELSCVIEYLENTLKSYKGSGMKQTRDMLAEARDRFAFRANPRAAIAASGAGALVAMRAGQDVAQHVAGYIHRSFGPFSPQLPLRIDVNLVELMRVRRELAMTLEAGLSQEQLVARVATAKRSLDDLIESIENKRHHHDMSYAARNMNAGGMRSMPGSYSGYDAHRAKRGNDPAESWGTVDDSIDNYGGHVNLKQAYDNMKGFFGEIKPGREHLFESPQAEAENQDYPEAFNQLWGNQSEGTMERNGHIEKLMIEKTVNGDSFWIQTLAPWTYCTSRYITWNATIFNKTTLDRLPEETVPRLMSNRRMGGATSLMRYGIALLLEATFAETAIGRRTYLMNLEQIRVATTDTAAYGVLITLMEHQPYTDQYARGESGNRGVDLAAIDERLITEIDGFGIMQKEADGGDLVRSRMRKTLAARGVTPNVMIWPSGTSSYIAMGSSGDLFNQESMPFSTGSDEGMHDPLFRHRTIGAFLTLDDAAVRKLPVEEYRTSHMDTIAYDGMADKMFFARYADGYRYTGTWNYNTSGAPLTEKIGGSLMRDLRCYTYGQVYKKCLAGQLARAVKKTYLAGQSDHSKRAEFLETILLHKADDPRVALGGRPFPENWSQKVFDEPRFFSRDRWAQRPLTVDDHKRADDAKNSFTVRALNERADYNNRVQTYKRKLGLDEEADDYDRPRTATVDYANGNPMDEETQVIPARTLYTEDGRVAHVPATMATVRTVRPRTAGGAAVKELTASYAGVGVDSYVAEIKALLAGHNWAGADQAAKQADEEWFVKAIISFCTQTTDAQDASDAQKITLLTELKRVIDGVFYTAEWSRRDATVIQGRAALNAVTPVTAAAEATYKAVLLAADAMKPAEIDAASVLSSTVAGFAPFAARMQTRFAVDALQEERTRIEDLVSSATSSLHQPISTEVADASALWKPDATSDDDGQVRLALFLTPDTQNTLPIPHDAFAATLAAKHNVIFDMSFAAGSALAASFNPAVSTSGIKRSRIDQLYWSIALSALTAAAGTPAVAGGAAAKKPTRAKLDTVITSLVAGLAPPAASAASPSASVTATIAARASVRTRLVRAAKQASSHPALPSQLHLARYIRALSDWLAAQLTSSPIPAESLLNDSFKIEVDDNNASPPGDYKSPVKQHIRSLLVTKTAAPFVAPVTTPANAEQAQTWSIPFVSQCFERASVHSGRLYAWCVDNDVPVPFALRMWRPNKCYNMASAIMLKAGQMGAAKTYYQMPHMMMAGNAAQKMIYGHFTMYFKTVVLRNDMITIYRDIYSSRHVGGSGRASWDPNNKDHTSAYKNHQLSTASCFWTFVRQNQSDCHWWQSITGTLPASIPGDETVRSRIEWDGASGFADHWKYGNGGADHSPELAFKWRTDRNDRRHNVICIQDFQMKYDPSENRYSDIVINAGHWGPNSCYPGAAVVLRGNSKTFQLPNYMPTKRHEIVRVR